MKIRFLGTGEATDENNPNTSFLLLGKKNILFDCGYSVPQNLWKFNSDVDFLDAIYISHIHADHYFGLPALLCRMDSDKRKKAFKIICQQKQIKIIQKIIELGYPGIEKRVDFPIEYIGVKVGDIKNIYNYQWMFEKTEHFVSNFAIKVSKDDTSFCYSGDGNFNQKNIQLYKKTNLLIIDTYSIELPHHGHGNMFDATKMAIENDIKKVAFVHLKRDINKKEVKEKITKQFKINFLIPKANDEVLI